MSGRPESRRRDDLRADCARCVGLCCVVSSFAKSDDFAFTKPGGQPCAHLDERNACGVHADLRTLGMRGCTVFDCFGAGQKVTQHTFAGRSWRDGAAALAAQRAAFPIVLGLHEMLWYLEQAVRLTVAHDDERELTSLLEDVRDLSNGSADELARTDVLALFAAVRPELVRVSAAVRGASAATHGRHHLAPDTDLTGADLAGADLRNVSLRDSRLVGADLSAARMARCELLGADLRDAELTGANLVDAIYLTQMQVNSARGDSTTRLPPDLLRPSHWPA